MHAYIFAKSTPKLSVTSSTTPQHQASSGSAVSTCKSMDSASAIGAHKSTEGKDSMVVLVQQGAGAEGGASSSQMGQSSSSGSDIYSGFVDCTAMAKSNITPTPGTFKSRASLVQITLPNNQVRKEKFVVLTVFHEEKCHRLLCANPKMESSIGLKGSCVGGNKYFSSCARRLSRNRRPIVVLGG